MSETLPQAALPQAGTDAVLMDALLTAEAMLGRLGRAAASVLAPMAGAAVPGPVPRGVAPVAADVPLRVPVRAMAALVPIQTMTMPVAAMPLVPADPVAPVAVPPPERAAAPVAEAVQPAPVAMAPRNEPLTAPRMMGGAVPVAPRTEPAAVPPWPIMAAPAAMPPAAPLTVAAAVAPSAVPLPSPLPSTAPQAEQAQAASAGGDVFLDGTRVGRWLGAHLADAAVRPQTGAAGFDPRMTPGFPGTLQGPWGWGG